MPNIDLQELYSQMQREMLAKLKTGSMAVVHPGTKGDETELNWINWFSDYLPKRYMINKGIVIDSAGKQSEQIDIIVYDAQYSYFVFHHDNIVLVPAESVYAILEVKQNLNKAHMEYAAKKVRSVRELFRTSAPIKHAGGEYPPKPLHEIIGGIITTTCDWESPIQPKVAEHIYNKSKLERLDLVCSISDGTFSVENNTFLEDFREEINPTIKFCDKDDSLVYLLLSILKKLQDIGTVPAIDFSKYAEVIDIKYYKKT